MAQAIRLTATVDTKELMAKFKKLSKVMRGNVLMEAAMEGAYFLQRRQQEVIRQKDIIDLGNLLGSIRAEPDQQSATFASAVTGTNVEYGLYHEFGTYKMAARPWMRPAFDSSTGKIEKIQQLYLARRLANI